MKTRQQYLEDLCSMSSYNMWSDLTINEIESIRQSALIELYGPREHHYADYFLDWLTCDEAGSQCYNMEGEQVAYDN